MSASDKKKLRREQSASQVSEKQRKQRAEDRELKVYTSIFVTAIALCLCVLIGVLGVRAVNNSGVIQKNTIAATIGNRELNSVELSYYYTDIIGKMYNEWYSQYQSNTAAYLNLMGLDVTKPLNKQIQDTKTGTTWAEYFVNEAIKQAKSEFALYDLAKSENFKLPEEEQKTLDNTIKNIDTYATIYGYHNANQYLRASYGYGAEKGSYSEYLERSTIAKAYAQAHLDSLTYNETQIQEFESDISANYDSYNFDSIYLSYTNFLSGGTKGDGGTTTYSDEEKDAAREKLKEVAEELATATSLEDLKAKLAAVKFTSSTKPEVTTYKNELHTSISNIQSKWLSDESRNEGDIAALANTSTTTDSEGKEKTNTNGYYITIFNKRIDNRELMSNVRHLLVKFKGGTKDTETNTTVYSDEEKATAKKTAEGYLKTWQEGAATEESFIELVKKHSDDSSAKDGGLFEDIHPDSSYVEPFLNWSIDDARKAGDAEIIESEYGYHVMYYVGDDEMTYRDYMITNDMRSKDQETWYNAALEPIKTSVGDISKLNLDLIISVS